MFTTTMPCRALLAAVVAVCLGACATSRTARSVPSSRTIAGVTYTAGFTLDSSVLRAELDVTNLSSSRLAIGFNMDCPLRVQLRADSSSSSDVAAWDSSGFRKGVDCVSGMGGVSVPSGSTRRLITEALPSELNALESGSYKVLVQVWGEPTPGWLYAGRVTIPIR
jgi:hypothetical protein